MIDLKSVALIGGIGVIGALWQNIKNFFAYIASVAVISVDFQYRDTGEAFLIYAWKNWKYIPLGERRVDIWSRYIKPKGRYGAVAHECSSQTMTFLCGWKPIFVKKEKASEGYYRQDTKIRFIRGTFKVDELMAKVAAEYDNESHKLDTQIKNFEVKRFFGKSSTTTAMDENHYMKGAMSASSCRPLAYKHDELGSPTSAQPFDGLAYNEEIMKFKDEIVAWKKDEEWHKSKGLRWRLGAGLYGLPGTGKTSFVRACAQEIDVPIHIYDLTTMSNEELTKFWQQSLAAAPCMVLFEDIDRIFDSDKKVQRAKDKAPITLDCLLNLINGVEPADGILVFVTANNMAKIDPALGQLDENGKPTRPGRLDRIIIFGPLTEKARRQVASRILGHMPEEVEKVVLEGKGETGAQFEDRCATIAKEARYGKPKIYMDDEVDISQLSTYEYPKVETTVAETSLSDAPSSGASPSTLSEAMAESEAVVGEPLSVDQAVAVHEKFMESRRLKPC